MGQICGNNGGRKMTAFGDYKYNAELTLHISTPDDSENFFSTNIDIHADYDVTMPRHMSDYDIPSKIKREVSARNPHRQNFFIGI